ncbi:hypothetical protein AOQ84DRAFT_352119 [Glonium stellatum]|uniref:Uncharacterized protein n=1 Tax=Glonium stellatum TaxID=574774 RepID=A0A8E2F9R5_9PEZI|nr:hypothetical protein AOQ84DRAFT_352119 [Glonium stellatum]
MQSTHLDIAAPNATDEASEERGNSPYLSLDTAENDDSDSGEMESADVLEELKPRPISTHRKREISQTADKLPIPDDAERVKRLSSASGSTYVTTRSGRSSVETFRTATTGNFSLYRASTMSRCVFQISFFNIKCFPCIVSSYSVWKSNTH